MSRRLSDEEARRYWESMTLAQHARMRAHLKNRSENTRTWLQVIGICALLTLAFTESFNDQFWGTFLGVLCAVGIGYQMGKSQGRFDEKHNMPVQSDSEELARADAVFSSVFNEGLNEYRDIAKRLGHPI